MWQQVSQSLDDIIKINTSANQKHNESTNAYSLCGDVLRSDMIDICQNIRDHMDTYYKLMKEGFVTHGFIPSLNVIPKRELNDLL